MPEPAETTTPPTANTPAAGPGSSLFRSEALDHQRPQWLGTILVEPRVGSSRFVYFAVIAASLVLLLLIFGSYTKKQRVNGWLVPNLGVARIVAPQPGIVSEIHVIEGETVSKGTPLVTLSSDVQTRAFGTTRAEVVRKLEMRRDSMAEQKSVERGMLEKREDELMQRAEALREEEASLERQIRIQKNIIQLSEDTLKGLQPYQKQGYISLRRVRQVQREKLDQAARLESLARSLSASKRDRLQVERELDELPFRRKRQLSQVERNVASLDQQLAEAESRRQVVITAPQDGTITSIQTEPGGPVNTQLPLLSLVPSGAVLQAHLFTPSRAIGFARAGQQVRLRYHAYPYQKFGSYEGQVASVSRAAVSPTELPSKLAGMARLATPNEPVYRVTVDLERQSAIAYGRDAPLQAGMQLEADLIIETRRLYEWILDPLYTLTGR